MPPFNAHKVDEDFFVSLCGTADIPRICGYGYGHQQPEDPVKAWLQDNILIVIIGTMVITATLFYAYVVYKGLRETTDLEAGIPLQEMVPKTAPASSAVVDALPSHTVTEEEAEEHAECVICCEEFEVGDEVIVLPCGHKFQAGCIKPWLLQKGLSK
ncbi:hypothetical protein CLAFUW4_06153 [Fulvia fulva]|uniref:RING-type domain-containing protein n=1 Tax=Passalora fulva TaxID=5499 RepID=A0A9Q8P8V8_PASFU|nr:uncharacterized protein CLAFUR5_06297 [Fulvia fulva]KAK4623929.1 hypothetical protein CLAFUR4_06156 [Fulvia fulva]KAK4625171.1 hypothetical protein CLAFUR0_06160 [Fulvia fulva]UJO17518.1 hypothetical protein CLAFUR5_06297 [Fulvia fulva]WPV14689.1 hypothetical protein CLAFUW4_06153 [Fulvia fulva]WPV29896.1 hypothetical protein CLAFUW7_06149 [Fulvia fulva]